MRPLLRRGDIILCSDPYSLISFLIRKVEKCHWSHTAWVVDDDHAVEALAGGVKRTRLSKKPWHIPGRLMVVRLKPGAVSPDGLNLAVAKAESLVGHPYDWLGIVRLAWAWATKRRHDTPVDGSRRAWWCSELIGEPLYSFCWGFTFRDEIPPENTAPKDIAISDKVEQVWP